MRVSSMLWKFAVVAVGFPSAASMVAWIVVTFVLGCNSTADSAYGSCLGLRSFLATTAVFGFSFAIGALIIVLPICVALAMVIHYFQGGTTSNEEKRHKSDKPAL